MGPHEPYETNGVLLEIGGPGLGWMAESDKKGSPSRGLRCKYHLGFAKQGQSQVEFTDIGCLLLLLLLLLLLYLEKMQRTSK